LALLFTVALLTVFVSACSSGDDAADDGVIAPAAEGSETYSLGQTIYNAQCASCHGIDGQGQFPEAPMERDATGRFGAPPHNETGHTWHHDDATLIEITRDGGMGDPVNFYAMPAFDSVLSDAEIEAVIAYIKTMWTSTQQAQQRERTLSTGP
jgi:mono/diheme cytochrome c family protein